MPVTRTGAAWLKGRVEDDLRSWGALCNWYASLNGVESIDFDFAVHVVPR